MNAHEFGHLLAALRKQTRNPDGLPFTQASLAQAAGLSTAVIGKLERGEKIPADPDVLPRLAQVFHLSTREKHEFFFAALGIEAARQAALPSKETAFDTLYTALQQISLPAFIVDAYDDLLAANASIVQLFSFSQPLQQQASQQVGGYNILRFVFSRQSQFGNWLGSEQTAYLRQSIAFFRAISLPVRGTPYFQQLLRAFRADPTMSAFTAMYEADSSQDDFFFEGLHFSLQHPLFKQLTFFSPPVYPIYTSQGGLYLIPYLPADAHSLDCCLQLAQQAPQGALGRVLRRPSAAPG